MYNRCFVATVLLVFLCVGLGMQGGSVRGVGLVLREDAEWVGTCFAISPEIVLTAWHVLDALELGEGKKESKDEGEKKMVKLRIDGKAHDAEVVWSSKGDDVAALRIKGKRLWDYLRVDFREVSIGEELTICGFVERQLVQIPVKVVSPTFYLEWTEGETILVLASPAAWHGTSGSPVLDKDGEVVALHVGRLGTALSLETPLVKVYKQLRDLLREQGG